MRPRTLRECMEGGSYCNSGPPRKQKERQYFWRVPLLAHANTGIQDRRERRCRPWKRRWATRQGSQRTEQGLECSRSSLVKLSNRSPRRRKFRATRSRSLPIEYGEYTCVLPLLRHRINFFWWGCACYTPLSSKNNLCVQGDAGAPR